MDFLTTATLSWFNDGCCDIKYLDIWANEPTSYTPGQALDDSWYRDEQELSLGQDHDGRLFQHAAHLLLHYQFYPPHLLTHTSDFSLDERPMQIGDLLLQRMHLVTLRRFPLLDVLGLTRIHQVTQEPRHCGFTHITLTPHPQEGEWSAHLTWQPNGELLLTLKAISHPRPQEPRRNHQLLRRLQKSAHQQGLNYFKKQLTANH